MVRRSGIAIVLLVVGALCAGGANAASEGGPITQSCTQVDEHLRGPCRGVEQIASAGAATCRWAGAPDAACATPVTPKVSAAEIDAFQGSWVDRSLRTQYALGGDVGLRNAPWIGTHNSFNSTAEMGPTLSDTDANQQLSLTDQLRIDVRSLELDVHWFPSASTGGSRAPVVCHAEGNHAGCSVEKPLGTVLDEIAAWLRLPENRDQVLLLYVEDHLDNAEGYDAAAAAVNGSLGDLVYRPSGPGCTPLPLDLTRDGVLASGAQVLIVSGCGSGEAWPAVAFDWSSHEETRPVGFGDFPGCGPDYDRATYDAKLIRYFEDSTGLTAGASLVGASTTDDGITPETAARMARCGADLLGMDQILPGDGRLESLVWSWAHGQPAAGDCAVDRVDGDFPYGRWESRGCGELHPGACRTATGSWVVSGASVPEVAAARRCRALGATLAVPRTGYENQLLRVAMQAAGVAEAWLGYHRNAAGQWVAEDPRP